jgi:hypothetical protein
MQALEEVQENHQWWTDRTVQVVLGGKDAVGAAMLDIGRLVAETVMYMKREQQAGRTPI